jgi:sugar lactone lactonase YvrE
LIGTTSTLAGTAGTTGSTDATGSAASFNHPYDITTDRKNLYVADTGNNTIRKIVIASGVVTTLAGTPGTTGSTDATGSAARFDQPYDITTDETNLYVADLGNNTIRKIVIATGAVTTLAGTAGTTGSTDATGSAASFNIPMGITTDGVNLYVADYLNNTIRKIVIATGAVTTLAGTAGTTGSTDATGSAASFNYPNDITTDGVSLYVSDTGNGTIRKVAIATGAVITLAGTAGTFGSTDATGSAASFKNPLGITTDGTRLYVCDVGPNLASPGNNTIRSIQ